MFERRCYGTLCPVPCNGSTVEFLSTRRVQIDRRDGYGRTTLIWAGSYVLDHPGKEIMFTNSPDSNKISLILLPQQVPAVSNKRFCLTKPVAERVPHPSFRRCNLLNLALHYKHLTYLLLSTLSDSTLSDGNLLSLEMYNLFEAWR